MCSSVSESCDVLNCYNSESVQAKSPSWGSLNMCGSIVCWFIASKIKGSSACVLKQHQSKQLYFYCSLLRREPLLLMLVLENIFQKRQTSTHISVTVKCVLRFSGSILETEICWLITNYMLSGLLKYLEKHFSKKIKHKLIIISIYIYIY